MPGGQDRCETMTRKREREWGEGSQGINNSIGNSIHRGENWRLGENHNGGQRQFFLESHCEMMQTLLSKLFC